MKLRLEASRKTYAWFAFSVLVAFFAGWYGNDWVWKRYESTQSTQVVRYYDANYPLINPLVSVRYDTGSEFKELSGVKRDVSAIVADALKSGSAADVAVYFRLPENVHTFGINDDHQFYPGSLIKVPILLSVLKKAETNPSILNKAVHYDPKLIADIPNALKAQLPEGTYSLSKLLETMIMNSDNVAKEVLVDTIGITSLEDVFQEAKLDFLNNPSGTINPRQYMVFFSRIYNATYLNRYYSNYAMELLTRTTYADGLVAGVPKDVKVAHKYGESGVYEDGALTYVELHDCGLIYAQDNPYYLCVMTKGKKTADLANIIKNISAKVYAERDSFKPPAQ